MKAILLTILGLAFIGTALAKAPERVLIEFDEEDLYGKAPDQKVRVDLDEEVLFGDAPKKLKGYCHDSEAVRELIKKLLFYKKKHRKENYKGALIFLRGGRYKLHNAKLIDLINKKGVSTAEASYALRKIRAKQYRTLKEHYRLTELSVKTGDLITSAEIMLYRSIIIGKPSLYAITQRIREIKDSFDSEWYKAYKINLKQDNRLAVKKKYVLEGLLEWNGIKYQPNPRKSSL